MDNEHGVEPSQSLRQFNHFVHSHKNILGEGCISGFIDFGRKAYCYAFILTTGTDSLGDTGFV